MNFAFNEEQEEFREMLRRFFEEKVPAAELRRALDSPEGYEPALWKQMAAELGLQGIHLPESCGGQGFGFLELGIVLEEMGRMLVPGPYLATVALAGSAILVAGDESQQRELLPGIASGETQATLAICEASGRWDASGIATRAEPDGGGHRLSGRKTHVLDGATADLLVVSARTPEAEPALFCLAREASGVTATPFEGLDPLRRYAHLELDGAAATRLGPDRDGESDLRHALQLGAIALGAEMLGGAQRCLDMAVAYAKERVQFGHPIGSFQAVKHKVAEVLLEVECARSAAYWSWCVADGDDADQRAEAAHLAKALCADAYRLAAAENVQIHGGIGFSWEHDAQLYYKRAASSDALLGEAAYHRACLASTLGLKPPA